MCIKQAGDDSGVVIVLTVKTVSMKEAKGELKVLYDRIVGRLGIVPDYFLALSLTPKNLDAFWNAYEEIIYNSPFTEKVRGMIRFEVAKADGCPVCKKGHIDLLRMYGISDDEIFLLDKEIKETKYDDKTKYILVFAYTAAADSHVESKVVDAFRGLGIKDEELVWVTTMVSLHKALLQNTHSLGFHGH